MMYFGRFVHDSLYFMLYLVLELVYVNGYSGVHMASYKEHLP